MNYRLYLDYGIHQTYRSLPEPVRQRLAAMPVDALVDPYAASRPYGATATKATRSPCA